MNAAAQTLSVEEAKAILKGSDLRCMAARIAVVQSLHSATAPVTSIELAELLSGYGFDKSTIYRSLTELNEADLVVRLDLGDSIRRFELAANYGSGLSEHPHFMCVDCGEVTCLSDFTFELKASSRKVQAPGTISEVLVRGHCTACTS